MKVSVTVSVDGEQVSLIESEQPNRISALAWVSYVETLCILIRDRDVTKSGMVALPET